MRRVLPGPRLPAAAMLAAALLAGCAGPAPDPVAVVQPGDAALGCPAILAEAQANRQQLAELGREKGAKLAQNIAAGVAGLFVWPLWFAMDFQGAASTDAQALAQRQQYLAVLAGQRGCGFAPAVTPARADRGRP